MLRISGAIAMCLVLIVPGMASSSDSKNSAFEPGFYYYRRDNNYYTPFLKLIKGADGKLTCCSHPEQMGRGLQIEVEPKDLINKELHPVSNLQKTGVILEEIAKRGGKRDLLVIELFRLRNPNGPYENIGPLHLDPDRVKLLKQIASDLESEVRQLKFKRVIIFAQAHSSNREGVLVIVDRSYEY